jgi:hypothetical protein
MGNPGSQQVTPAALFARVYFNLRVLVDDIENELISTKQYVPTYTG